MKNIKNRIYEMFKVAEMDKWYNLRNIQGRILVIIFTVENKFLFRFHSFIYARKSIYLHPHENFM